MKNSQSSRCFWPCWLAVGLAFMAPARHLHGQSTADSATNTAKVAEPITWTTQQDHKNMMDQLGIKRLRPGPSGQAGATNSANYDPAKANPYPDWPGALALKNGQKVTLGSN